MKTNIRKINGNWNLGYVLDKHTVSSTFIGYDEYDHPRFDTLRTEVGEALFQLKNRNNYDMVQPLAAQIVESIFPLFDRVGLIVPAPASTFRVKQPVTEICHEIGRMTDIGVFTDIVQKIRRQGGSGALKNMSTKEEKLNALDGRFTILDDIEGSGAWNALLVDDLYDTGATMESVCATLRTYPKIDKIYVAALTWK